MTSLAATSGNAELPLLFISGGPWEYVIILLVVLLLFGNKLPKMARSMGESFIEFKKGVKGDSEAHLEDGSKAKGDAAPVEAPEKSETTAK